MDTVTEALAIRPDLIILDFMLPAIDIRTREVERAGHSVTLTPAPSTCWLRSRASEAAS
jgi:hypothetical protein